MPNHPHKDTHSSSRIDRRINYHETESQSGNSRRYQSSPVDWMDAGFVIEAPDDKSNCILSASHLRLATTGKLSCNEPACLDNCDIIRKSSRHWMRTQQSHRRRFIYPHRRCISAFFRFGGNNQNEKAKVPRDRVPDSPVDCLVINFICVWCFIIEICHNFITRRMHCIQHCLMECRQWIN